MECNTNKENDKKEQNKIDKKIVGLFQKNKSFGFVVPDDKKIKTHIFISKKNMLNAKNNEKVIVEITKEQVGNNKPEGKIVEIYGNYTDIGIDVLSIVKEYDLPYEFPVNVNDELKEISNKVNIEDIKNRVDLRGQEIFTIDGEDAKDLDDAVSVEINESGNFVLNVHIADVSNYVKENSEIDKEALLRGTSVYMLDRVIPMLPKELSNGICSLNANEDRLTLSVNIEIDNNGDIINSNVYKAVICVTKRTSYKEVTAALEQNNHKYIQHFKRMEQLAKILINKREKNGSLTLDIPEAKIILDNNGKALDIVKVEATIANNIIEQFMVIANEVIAEKFFWLEAPFMYRVHENPDIEKIEELNKFLHNLGYKIKASKESIFPKAFQEVLEKSENTKDNRVISNLILRTFKVARYSNENEGHFGLASKYYCHFTSPIRRYPDLFIHRIISKYLETDYNVSEETIQRFTKNSEEYSKLCSDRERIAWKAERDSQDMKKAEYMEDKVGQTYEAIITSITSFGVFAELENTVEGLIRFDDLGKDYFVFNEERKNLVGERTKQVFNIGDKIKIKVADVDKIARRVKFIKIS